MKSANVESTSNQNNLPAIRDSTPWIVRFQRLMDEMTESERRVGAYFADHPDSARKSINEVIESSKLGYGTVIRFCQKLGCRGFQEFKVLMARDMAAARPDDEMAEGDGFDAIYNRAKNDVSSTAQRLDAQEVKKAAQCLVAANRVLCIGVASSAPLALSLDWKIKRCGITSSFVSDGYVMAVEAALLRPGDAIVAVSSSGVTKDIVSAARLARDAGATVIAVTNFTKTPLVDAAHIRLIASVACDPLLAEVPMLVAGEVVFEVLIHCIRQLKPDVEECLLETFSAIADRKL